MSSMQKYLEIQVDVPFADNGVIFKKTKQFENCECKVPVNKTLYHLFMKLFDNTHDLKHANDLLDTQYGFRMTNE